MAIYQTFAAAPTHDTDAHSPLAIFRTWIEACGKGFTALGWLPYHPATGVGEVVDYQSVTGASGSGTSFTFTWGWSGSPPVTDSIPNAVGSNFLLSGFTGANAGNNGTWVCTATTQGSVTLTIPSGGTAGFAGTPILIGLGNAYQFTTPVQPIINQTFTAAAAYQFMGAWVSGTTYTGGNTANSSIQQVVTVNGCTYACFTASNGASTTTSPLTDTTHWFPLNFNLFKSNGPMSGTNPLYMKIAYSQNTVYFAPQFFVSVGTGVDGNGQITGGPAWSATTNGPPTVVVASGYGTTPCPAPILEMDFSGDADNIRFALFRNAWMAGFSPIASVFMIDRAKTATGTDSDAFTYCGTSYSFGSTGYAGSGIIPKPSIGSPIMQSVTAWLGAICVSNITTSNWGSTPAYPIFPCVGFLANPCLGAVGVANGDVADGSLVSVWMYGASHNFLVCKGMPGGGGGSLNTIASAMYAAIRWE
jgi:hypothetical protein